MADVWVKCKKCEAMRKVAEYCSECHSEHIEPSGGEQDGIRRIHETFYKASFTNPEDGEEGNMVSESHHVYYQDRGKALEWMSGFASKYFELICARMDSPDADGSHISRDCPPELGTGGVDCIKVTFWKGSGDKWVAYKAYFSVDEVVLDYEIKL